MPTYRVIGLMSGTSLDGLDIAYCELTEARGNWQFQIVRARTLPYPEDWRRALERAFYLSAADLPALDARYGRWLGLQVRQFIEEYKIPVDFVASHGHTLFHEPARGFSYQLGSGQALAMACGLPVVADFRTKDVLAGGQGAPLVPLGDRELFGEFDFCLNLGGIANISYEQGGRRIAFDICPVNMLLNQLAARLGLPFDDNGRLAAGGQVRRDLLGELNALPYYSMPPPKSLGYEWFSTELWPLFVRRSEPIPDLLATAVQHAAEQIARAVHRDNLSPGARLLATGGGARNGYFLRRLGEFLGKQVEVIVPDDGIVDFKEALIFAFLGVRRRRGEPNCLASVTGAERDVCGGVLYLPHRP